MKTVQSYCANCGVRFTSERKSAKYHSESCKQIAKRIRKEAGAPSQMLDDFETVSGDLIGHALKYINIDHSPDMQLSLFSTLENMRDTIDKIEAELYTIETEQQNRWYQCTNCGQRAFGKVDKCDFCKSEKFRVITL